MTQTEFDRLEKNTFFYNIESGEEWVVLEGENGIYYQCTRGDQFFSIGTTAPWGMLNGYRFNIGRHPDNRKPYQPAHDEICTVLTTEGLATKCKAYHHNGAIYAIALKNDKLDGIFNPSQIEKFLKL